jgi:hypothetical protein
VSAFLDLVAEAETLGVTKLTWHCDVRDWSKDPRRAGRWSCRISGPGIVPAEGIGRTGEEAMREILGFLKAVA